jgi:hypothetical protein
MKNIKLISIMSCISIFLLTLALLTINNTFSFNEDIKKWDIHFETDNNNVIINDSRVDYYTSLEYGNTYSLTLDIVNDGDYNGELFNILKTSLEDMKIDDSKYTYDDFLTYSITYDKDSDENTIKKHDKVSTFDALKSGTKNTIRIDIRYDENKMNQEKKDYLNSHENKLNINLYLQLAYKQV